MSEPTEQELRSRIEILHGVRNAMVRAATHYADLADATKMKLDVLIAQLNALLEAKSKETHGGK